MALPDFSMRQLLEAGVHFGHQKHRWNPRMAPYIFGDRNKIHIIDLSKTVPLLHQALVAVREVVSNGGRVLFVGTKRQAGVTVAEAAKRCAQYYVNHRWLGGTLTNWKTISNSIRRLRTLDELLAGETSGLTKKELLKRTRERDRLERALGGIKEMGGVPDIVFVVDTNKESIAVKEALKLNIPLIAVVDTNSDPTDITYPIPGNDDAARAITLYCDLIARAVLDGISESQTDAGVDIGAAEEIGREVLPDLTKTDTGADSEAASVSAVETDAKANEELPAEPASDTLSQQETPSEPEPTAEPAPDTPSQQEAPAEPKPTAEPTADQT